MKASKRQNMKPLNSTACFCFPWKCPCCHLQPPLMLSTSVFMGCCLPRRATMYLCRSSHRGYLHLLQELLSPFIPQHKREIWAFIPGSEPENTLVNFSHGTFTGFIFCSYFIQRAGKENPSSSSCSLSHDCYPEEHLHKALLCPPDNRIEKCEATPIKIWLQACADVHAHVRHERCFCFDDWAHFRAISVAHMSI